MHEIYHDGILGEVSAYIYTIEFQKRTLPHAHVVVILKEPWKLKSPEDVDRIIRATWPDPVTEPALFETV
ncbi:hypothetical protein BDN72DRAFT_787591, partial [Pluteus cervinus]